MSFDRDCFLPVSKEDLSRRGWDSYDFLIVTGDAYVDHPSFGPAIIGRVLEAEGYRVAVLPQPDWKDAAAFTALGRPRLGVLISAGNIDSMVAHYTASKKPRHDDAYSPGRKAGLRPDHATVVYSNRVREAFGDIPILIGGLEASLRRFAHYDYWEDRVRRSILFDAQADILTYGMGETASIEIAGRLASGTPVREITDVRGTCVTVPYPGLCSYPKVEVPSFEEVSASKEAYARANMAEYEEHDPFVGKAILQKHASKFLLVNPPAYPLPTKELDRVAELPYVREPHPMYDALGGVPAIEEVRFSVTHNRGCFGACNFCSLSFHQGRTVTARSHESVIREVQLLIAHPGFKGYIHDVGGPSATFRRPSCSKQLKYGMCKNRACLAPEPCPNLDADHTDYMMLLRKLRALPGIKKVFVRSGIRFDFLMKDPSGEFFTDLVQHHISGQLKVAPEHCVAHTLDYMGKPHIDVYERFREKYAKLNRRYGKEQYLVPYLISSHPGCTLEDAVQLAEWLNKQGHMPEQVQDFYPTPGTLATCMWYTGIDPRTMKAVFVPKAPHDKALQRALMQWRKPQNRALVLEALRKTGREDLIGYGKRCLVRPDKSRPSGGQETKNSPHHDAGTSRPSAPSQGTGRPSGRIQTRSDSQRGAAKNERPPQTGKPVRKAGWAKPKPSGKPGRLGTKKHS